MPAISVVSDANIVLKWFHAEGEKEVEPAWALLDAHKERTVIEPCWTQGSAAGQRSGRSHRCRRAGSLPLAASCGRCATL